MTDQDHADVTRVEIAKEHLELLLYYARIGETRSSRRSWRHWFIRTPCCSGDRKDREPDCFECQAFTAAEDSLIA